MKVGVAETRPVIKRFGKPSYAEENNFSALTKEKLCKEKIPSNSPVKENHFPLASKTPFFLSTENVLSPA